MPNWRGGSGRSTPSGTAPTAARASPPNSGERAAGTGEPPVNRKRVERVMRKFGIAGLRSEEGADHAGRTISPAGARSAAA